MKPKKPTLLDRMRKPFKFLPLYLADLKGMVELAKERGFNYVVTDDDHEYENLEDLMDHRGNHVWNLQIKFFKEVVKYEDVTVEMHSKGKVTLRSDNGDEYIALAQKLAVYLGKRVPWYALLTYNILWVAMMMLSFPLIYFQTLDKPSEWLMLFIRIFFLFASVMYLVSLAIPPLLGGVHLQRKHEVTTIWAKGEKVFLLIIGGIVTTGIRWIADRYHF